MVLKQVAYSIANNEYIWVRQDVAELRDNCLDSGDLHDVFTSANAFLNTEGGDIYIGILDDEDNNCFVFKGYDHCNEEQLKMLPWAFTDTEGQPADLSENISFELQPFLDGKVMVIHILPVAEQLRPIYYQNTAWERLPSGNRKLSKAGSGHAAADESKIIVAEKAFPTIATSITEVDLSTAPNTNNAQELEEQPATEQQHTAFLISVFGSDFISLQPESKQLLSYIHDLNNKSVQPDLEEAAHRLAAINNTNTALVPITFKTARKTIQLLEKNRFLVRRKGAGLSINTEYQLVQNLFNW